MRRFLLLNKDTDVVDAEGVLFQSGMVAVSFIGSYRGIHTWSSLTDARNVHEVLGNRVFRWIDDWGGS